MRSENSIHRLIGEFQMGQISEENFGELELLLKESPEARLLFHRACRLDSHLRREAENTSVDQTQGEKVVPLTAGDGFRKQPFFKPFAAAAAVVLLSAITWTIAAQKRVVATFVSSEDAVWEGGVLAEPGAPITKGSLRLASGIATIRFVSGAELTLEAPARLYAKGPLRATLVFGTVLVKSKQKDDFVLETANGQAASQQGEFAAFSMQKESRVDFESISGKVTISHDISRDVTQITSGATASMFSDRLESSGTHKDELPFERLDNGALIRTNGRSASFIRNNNIHKWTRPEFLTMKASQSGHGFDQRSVVAFDLSKIDASAIDTAVLHVELVRSGSGLVSRLPKVNRFTVYGLVNPSKENWSTGDQWDEAPSPEDGVSLLHFEIPRSQTSGTIDLKDESLTRFIQEKAGRAVSLIFVRETTNREGEGPGYTHAIASDSHPEASGPTLEIVFNK